MKSLLDKLVDLEYDGKIEFNNRSCDDLMYSKESFNSNLKKLNKSIEEDDPLGMYLSSARFVRGFLDYCIETNQNPIQDKLKIREIIKNIYSGNLNQARTSLDGINFDRSLRNKIFEEKKDYISWNAFSPIKNLELAEKIGIGFTPEIVLIDGHGGYRPGFLVASYFNSDIFPIRCSMGSKGDKKPRLLPREENEIRNDFDRKRILIATEDSSTGRAIDSLKKLVKQYSPYSKLRTAATIFIPDVNDYTIVDYFGERKTVFS